MAEKEEKVSLTKAELETMLSEREKRGKMTNEEKAIRAIVAEESESTVRRVLGEFFDMNEPPGDNDGGGKQEDFWGKLARQFGLTGSDA